MKLYITHIKVFLSLKKNEKIEKLLIKIINNHSTIVPETIRNRVTISYFNLLLSKHLMNRKQDLQALQEQDLDPPKWL
jgi:hypothetical protein